MSEVEPAFSRRLAVVETDGSRLLPVLVRAAKEAEQKRQMLMEERARREAEEQEEQAEQEELEATAEEEDAENITQETA